MKQTIMLVAGKSVSKIAEQNIGSEKEMSCSISFHFSPFNDK